MLFSNSLVVHRCVHNLLKIEPYQSYIKHVANEHSQHLVRINCNSKTNHKRKAICL